MIYDLKRSIHFRWLMMSGAIFISDDVVIFFAQEWIRRIRIIFLAKRLCGFTNRMRSELWKPEVSSLFAVDKIPQQFPNPHRSSSRFYPASKNYCWHNFSGKLKPIFSFHLSPLLHVSQVPSIFYILLLWLSITSERLAPMCILVGCADP